MKYGWNAQSQFWLKRSAESRKKRLIKKGMKAKVTKRMSTYKGKPRPLYTVWMWWKWKD